MATAKYNLQEMHFHGSRTLTTAVCHVKHRIIGCTCNYCDRAPDSYASIVAHYQHSVECKRAAGNISDKNVHVLIGHRHAVALPANNSFSTELSDLDTLLTSPTSSSTSTVCAKYLSVDDSEQRNLPEVPTRYQRISDKRRRIYFNLLCHVADISRSGLESGPPL